MDTITTPEASKPGLPKFALLWISLIIFCLLFFLVSLGLLSWGFYSVFQQAEEKARTPYATATAMAQWPLVYSDDFLGVKSEWYVGNYTEDGRHEMRSISNGTYAWTLENAAGWIYWEPADIGNFTDFALSVDVRHIIGSLSDGYGLIFGKDAKVDNYHLFAIRDSGEYYVSTLISEKWNRLVPPSRTDAIRPGEWNHLSVLAEDGLYKLYINNEFVGEFRDQTLPSGEVGLTLSSEDSPVPLQSEPNGVAHTFASSISKAEFDNFEVRAPAGSVTNPNSPIKLPKIEPEAGRLVFASYQAKYRNRHIFTISTNGKGLTQLTDGPADDYAPRWSPDGKKIAFVSKRDGNSEIYVMDADGRNVIRLTNNPAKDDSLDWLPDGKQIIFSSNRNGNYELYRMSADGEAVSISQLTDTKFDELDPAVSQDGMQILFTENEVGTYKLSMMDIAGQQRKRLTKAADIMAYSAGAWAPDGVHFACTVGYLEVRDLLIGDKNQIADYLIGDRVTWPKGTILYPSWSPGGKQLVFVSDVEGRSDLYIILADGSGFFRVTNTEADDESPDWAAP